MNTFLGNFSLPKKNFGTITRFLRLLLITIFFLHTESCIFESNSGQGTYENLPSCDGGVEQAELSLQFDSHSGPGPCLLSSVSGLTAKVTVISENQDGTQCKCFMRTTIWDGYSNLNINVPITGRPFTIDVDITANCHSCCSSLIGGLGHPHWTGTSVQQFGAIYPEVLCKFSKCTNCP